MQADQFLATQSRHRVGAAFVIAELYFYNRRGKHFDDGTDLSAS